MYYLKIKNLVNQFGSADYKGLDINLFICGSQIYDLDPTKNYCVIATDESIIPTNDDIQIITESEYLNERQIIVAKQKANDPVEQLKQQLNEQSIALAALIGGAV